MAAIYLGRLMKERGLSQLELAKALGWNQGRISALISSKKRPTSKERAVLSKFFNLSASILFEVYDPSQEDLYYAKFADNEA